MDAIKNLVIKPLIFSPSFSSLHWRTGLTAERAWPLLAIVAQLLSVFLVGEQKWWMYATAFWMLTYYWIPAPLSKCLSILAISIQVIIIGTTVALVYGDVQYMARELILSVISFWGTVAFIAAAITYMRTPAASIPMRRP